MNTSQGELSYKNPAKAIEWRLLAFLVLFMDVKLAVELLALVLIYVFQPDFKFGFRLKQSRLPLYYQLIIGIARFDADDICFPDRLEKQYKFMISNPDYIVSGSGADYIDNKGNHIFTYRPIVKTNEEIQKLPENICPFIHICRKILSITCML